MSPAEVKQLEKKIERLEKKLDLIIRHISIQSDNKAADWLDHPQITKRLEAIIAESEEDIKAGRVEPAKKIFRRLGV